MAAGATAGAALVALIFLPARARNVLPPPSSRTAAEPEKSAAASAPATEVCATRS